MSQKQESLICPKCNGTGKEPKLIYETCMDCNGLGHHDLGLLPREPCRNCKGTGKTFQMVFVRCSHCNGGGKIAV